MTHTASKKFSAKNVIVLNLTNRPDEDGVVFPPYVLVEFANPVPLVFEHDWRRIIGHAYLMRVNDAIVADIHLNALVQDAEEAESLELVCRGRLL